MSSPNEMKVLFSPEAHQLLLMKLEVALARVQARMGIIPVDAAEQIADSATLATVPIEAVAAVRARVGHPMVALLEAWEAALPNGAGEWLHYGATTQDIEDTALLIESRSAVQQLLARLERIEERLLHVAEDYAATPMIGRTVGRHALPMTFGLKVSRWAAENHRSMERLRSWLARHSMGMLSGAVGSYASMGPDALAMERAFVAELGLDGPWTADWKGSRDMFAELGSTLSILAMTWRKIAQEIFLLQGDDIGELVEQTDKVGSSTMPHKRNPSRCRSVVALSRLIPRLSDVLLDWMVSIYERDQISSAPVVKEVFVSCDDMLRDVEAMVDALEVRPDKMLENMSRSGDLIMAEHAMFVLSGHIGKQTAHKIVRRAAYWAMEKGASLGDALREASELRDLDVKLDWSKELNPITYLGLSEVRTKDLVAAFRKVAASEPVLS